MVVGPLLKQDVQALADMRKHRVPVLALNYLDERFALGSNFFQLGLAPEDEAREAAASAIAAGQTRAVALSLEGDWGARILAAFKERYEELGGKLENSRTFADGTHDFSEPIRELLGITGSEERNHALTRVLGHKLVFAPRGRRDIDVIFLVARAEQSRLILPELRFFGARHLPVYATSSVYDRPVTTTLREGLRFCDMPLMLQSDGPLAQLREDLESTFPSTAMIDSRLQGLGYDAFSAGMAIAEGRLPPKTALPGATGTLVMEPDGRIRRTLPCAEIAGREVHVTKADVAPGAAN